MAKGKPTDPLLRAEIVGKIRDEGMSVAVASATYGFSSKTIYTWFGKWFLFQTFEELDSVKDKKAEVRQIRKLLESENETSAGRI